MRKELKSLVHDFKNYLAACEQEDFAGLNQSVPQPSVPAELPPQPAPVRRTPSVARAEAKPSPIPAIEPVAAVPPPSGLNAEEAVASVVSEVVACKKCPLGQTRIKPAVGRGSLQGKIIFIGEGPGFEEDHKGEPFVGKAGQLLDKMIAAMTLKPGDFYIANIVKCHPMIDPSDPEKRGNDRPPSPEEIQACYPYLLRQIQAVNPGYIIALGAVAAKVLTGTAKSLGSLRGRIHRFKASGGDIPMVATYHPAALLRNPAWKKDAWDDMQLMMKEMGLSVPGKNG